MTLPRLLFVSILVAFACAGTASAAVSLEARDVALPASASARGTAAPQVLPARRAPLRFNLVGLHWRGSGDVWFRTARSSGPWSAWHAARHEGEDAPDAGSAEGRSLDGWKLGDPFWTGSARRVQYRVEGSVTRLRAYFLWSPVTAAKPVGRALASTTRPAIVTRAGWNANESIVRGSPSYASRLAFAVVHHTAGGVPTSPSQSAAMVRGIQSYHVRSNGWNDIGYNFLVDPFGQIFEGRRGGMTRNVIGAHAEGFNTGSVGVSVLGSYGTTAPSAAAQAALVRLLAWRLDLAHVDPTSQRVVDVARQLDVSRRGRRSSSPRSAATASSARPRARGRSSGASSGRSPPRRSRSAGRSSSAPARRARSAGRSASRDASRPRSPGR